MARIGNNGKIITTVYTYGEKCGPYYIPAWDLKDASKHRVPENFHVYESNMWYIMAENRDVVLIFPMGNEYFAMLYESGQLIMYNQGTNSQSVFPVKASIDLPSLTCVGFVRTCPKYLAPKVLPYHLNADIANKVLYVGDIPVKYAEKLDTYDIPPLMLYKSLIDDEADWVVSINGKALTFKKGGL